MQATEITFGIEIECLVPVDIYESTGMEARYGRPPQAPQMPVGWKAKTDCSIRNEDGYYPVEFVSPILKGREGLEQVKTVVAKLNEWNAKVNKSCGMHIHAGVDTSNELGLINVIRLAAQHEKALYASTGTKSRENNRMCKPVAAKYKSLKNNVGQASMMEACRRDRYHSVNLMNIYGRTGTVEFRLFAPTLSFVKIAGHLASVLGIVEKAYTSKRKQSYEIEQGKGTANNGVEAVDRLIKRLKWTSNGGEGILDASLVPQIKKEFRRLAEQYDAR